MELRGEIVEAEKARCDLLKWKLGLVAGLGAAGLGLGSYHTADCDFHYILCLIPLVCVYVDLLAKHMTLRIMVIGCFEKCMAVAGNTESPYEQFAARARAMPFPSDDSFEKIIHNGNVLARFWTNNIKCVGINKYKMKGRKLAAYELEDWALQWSTIFLSILLIFYGIYVSWSDIGFSSGNLAFDKIELLKILPYILFGLFGLLLSFKVEAEYRLRLLAIQEIALN